MLFLQLDDLISAKHCCFLKCDLEVMVSYIVVLPGSQGHLSNDPKYIGQSCVV